MRLGIVLAGGMGLAACQIEEGRPPIARIDIVPGSIPENDGFQTEVTLDGSRSADPIDDPEGASPLDFHWEILGDEVRFEAGSDAEDTAPVVRFRGDRPATITLTVVDSDGLDASTTANLQLSVN